MFFYFFFIGTGLSPFLLNILYVHQLEVQFLIYLMLLSRKNFIQNKLRTAGKPHLEKLLKIFDLPSLTTCYLK